MVNTVYIEAEVRTHPRTLQILKRLGHVDEVEIDRYGEVFNPKAQNFRLQKSNPALILACKYSGHVLKAPAGYGIGGHNNYYFSHMLNCLYDCRYCFLQGMYNSAHQVVFVNYEDFAEQIEQMALQHQGEPVWFFSGYDCDSLAYEPVTGFIDYHLPVFDKIDNAWLEIRTKSTQIRQLLKQQANQRVICAFSFTDEKSHQKLEHAVPNIDKRIEAMLTLAKAGWPLGLRFDPLIYHADYKLSFANLLKRIFEQVGPEMLHSVSLGSFRLPKNNFKRIANLYPDEALFSQQLDLNGGMIGYPRNLEHEMMAYCEQEILKYIPESIFFPCSWHE